MVLRLVVFLAVGLALSGCAREEPLPQLYQIPQNTPLVTMRGTETTTATLRGNVTVYDFIFTRCKGICPLLTQRMKQLANAIDPSQPVRFASISVDPVHDTPAVLSRYAQQFGADERWMFYTGQRHDIVKLSVEGFKLAAGEPTSNPDEPILHSTRFVLADAEGMIRGYYDSNDPAALETLARDARRLAKEVQ